MGGLLVFKLLYLVPKNPPLEFEFPPFSEISVYEILKYADIYF